MVYAAQSGCQAAFDELVSLYSRRVHRTVLAITKNSEDAEDAMQESFLRAFLAISRFEGRASFYSWLMRIAINSALMILRRRRARPELSLSTPQEWSDEVTHMDFEDFAPNPEETYYHRQRRTRLTRAIRRLSPNLRKIVQKSQKSSASLKQPRDPDFIALARGLDIACRSLRSTTGNDSRAIINRHLFMIVRHE